MREHYELYLLALPAVIYFVVFCYLPMYGIQLAFRDYYPGLSSITKAEWIGLSNFRRFFRSYQSIKVIVNTLRISLLSLALSFPIPVLLALMLNEQRHTGLKKTLQTLSYAPHFISAVCMAGMLMLYCAESGLVNRIIELFGGKRSNLMASGPAFPWIYVLGNVWKNAGWSSIIYIAALSSVDISLYEAAVLDGANKAQRIWHIDLPSIVPTMVILLILNCGSIMSVGWEQILLMQNPLNTEYSEIISTYTYKVGLQNSDFSYSTSIGLFNSLVNFLLLVIVNAISAKVGEVSLW
ncbi:MAG: ABC transporter permease subunit [Eubacteriales bacterium]|nr:ABC transporter permease subunit [Eubacteriales bacterium]